MSLCHPAPLQMLLCLPTPLQTLLFLPTPLRILLHFLAPLRMLLRLLAQLRMPLSLIALLKTSILPLASQCTLSPPNYAEDIAPPLAMRTVLLPLWPRIGHCSLLWHCAECRSLLWFQPCTSLSLLASRWLIFMFYHGHRATPLPCGGLELGLVLQLNVSSTC